MSFALSARSRVRLDGVHPALIGVVKRAIQLSPVDFMVVEGLRGPARQAALVRAGASRTLNSRHITGHAVDLAALVDGRLRWDWPLYPRIAGAMKAAAAGRGVAVIWGGDWKSLKDGPHFGLDRRAFP